MKKKTKMRSIWLYKSSYTTTLNYFELERFQIWLEQNRTKQNKNTSQTLAKTAKQFEYTQCNWHAFVLLC